MYDSLRVLLPRSLKYGKDCTVGFLQASNKVLKMRKDEAQETITLSEMCDQGKVSGIPEFKSLNQHLITEKVCRKSSIITKAAVQNARKRSASAKPNKSIFQCLKPNGL